MTIDFGALLTKYICIRCFIFQKRRGPKSPHLREPRWIAGGVRWEVWAGEGENTKLH